MSPNATLKAYEESGSAIFYLLANGDDVVGVHSGSVFTLTFRNYQVVARLGPLAGSHADLIKDAKGQIAIITFADGARYYSHAITARWARDARDEVAEYNRLAGYMPGSVRNVPVVGYVPAEREAARQDPPRVVWSCRFCQTSNKDRTRCEHRGAPRP
jgi:hypothetical protein